MTEKKWYTPTGAVCRFCAMLAMKLIDQQAGPAFFFLYGAVDLLGVTGTTKLLYRMVKENGNPKSKNKKSTVPRVRNGS